MTSTEGAARIFVVGARLPTLRAVWLSAVATLAVPTACGGKSTTLEAENTAGEGGTGGASTGSGATGGTGGSGVGGTGSGATGSGATGSGATGGTGMGAAGGTGSTGGVGIGGMTSCDLPTLGDRRCLIDSDCRLSGKPTCCGTSRVYGVNRVTACAQDPVACDAECAGPQWITDTGEATTLLDEVRVRCEIGEPGAGVCVSYIDLGQPPPPTYCDGVLCTAEEVCVHYAAPGGPAPPCVPLFDGGTCDPDSVIGTCPDTGSLGCVRVAAAPVPECVLVSSCDPIDCDCLPADICGGTASQCRAVMGRDVDCVDLSP